MRLLHVLRLVHPTRLPLAALAVTVACLLLARPAGAVTPGPTPVVITGGAVTSTEAPAQPYVISLALPFGANVSSATNASTAIPAGKRMVVQSYSAYRSGQSAVGSVMQVYVLSTTGSQLSFWPLPLIQVGSTPYPGTVATTTFYADPGTFVQVNAYRSTTAASENLFVSISGYLVDAP